MRVAQYDVCYPKCRLIHESSVIEPIRVAKAILTTLFSRVLRTLGAFQWQPPRPQHAPWVHLLGTPHLYWFEKVLAENTLK